MMCIRIVTVATQEDNIETFFQFELNRKSMLLSKNIMMRKYEKPLMKKINMSGVNLFKKEDIQSWSA